MVRTFNPRARTERGGVVMNKLIRIILNQPNYTPDDFTMRLMIALSLFATLFFLTVYRNIFGSDLTVTEDAQAINYLNQLKECGSVRDLRPAQDNETDRVHARGRDAECSEIENGPH